MADTETAAAAPTEADAAGAGPTTAATTPVDLTGKWHLVRNENFDEFMKAAGIGIVKRKLIKSLSPTIEISQDGGVFKFLSKTSLGSRLTTFKVGVEYPETNPMWGDNEFHVLPEWQGEKLVQRVVNAPDGDTVPRRFEREIVNEELVITMRRGEMESKRYFKKV